ncbi:MAG: hypothetical protein V1792_22910 [Pseudomonadota bacterium]
MSYYDWRPYVPVAERRARAQKKAAKLRKQGFDIKPVHIEGRKIARTFWGEAWCDHIESFSDYENRLPRGRTYIRNGSVYHLDIAEGEVNAMVSGSESYTVKISVKRLPDKKWKEVKNRCAGQIGSILELLQGRLSKNVMSVVTHRTEGLFPLSEEISLKCSCPDWAVMCKHVAAALYGVGARLDDQPELLFLLRGVDHEELIGAQVEVAAAATVSEAGRRRIADDALADVFGIEMKEDVAPSEAKAKPKPRAKAKPESTAEEAMVKAKPEPVTEPKTATKRPPRGERPASKEETDATAAVKPKKKVKTKTAEETKAKETISGKAVQAQEKVVVAKNTSRPLSRIRPVTGKAVARLRAKFGMSRFEFARLLGVSAPSVGNWENKPGDLNLQPNSLEAWKSATGMTKRQARRKLDGS